MSDSLPFYVSSYDTHPSFYTCDGDGRLRGGAVLDKVGEGRDEVDLRRAVILGEGVGQEEGGRVRSLRKPFAAQGVLRHEQRRGHVVEVEADLLCFVGGCVGAAKDE